MLNQQYTKIQLFQKHYRGNFKIIDHKYEFSPENYCIPRRHGLIGQTTKQPLSNFEPQKP